MAPLPPQPQRPIWIQLSLIWRWPLALVLSAVALGEAGKQLLSKPVPVAISGAIPLTIAVASRLPVSIQAERSGGLQTQLTSTVGGLQVAPVQVRSPIQAVVSSEKELPVKVRSPIQAVVSSEKELPVKAAVNLNAPVKVAASEEPLRVEVEPSDQPMQVDVRQMDLLP
jgi:hypothetical protein